MFNKKYWVLFLIPLLLNACSNTSNPKYKDNSKLEMPPVIVNEDKAKAQMMQKDEPKEDKKGLGKVVSLSGPSEQPIIKIKKMFDRSWNIVEQGLNMNEIKITDKNRDKGVFYLKFDPDNHQADKDSGAFDNLTFFLFQDDYDETAYELKVIWRDSDTEVSVKPINQEESSLLDDTDDEFESSVDSGAKLIQVLFKTIKDDLPID